MIGDEGERADHLTTQRPKRGILAYLASITENVNKRCSKKTGKITTKFWQIDDKQKRLIKAKSKPSL